MTRWRTEAMFRAVPEDLFEDPIDDSRVGKFLELLPQTQRHARVFDRVVARKGGRCDGSRGRSALGDILRRGSADGCAGHGLFLDVFLEHGPREISETQPAIGRGMEEEVLRIYRLVLGYLDVNFAKVRC